MVCATPLTVYAKLALLPSVKVKVAWPCASVLALWLLHAGSVKQQVWAVAAAQLLRPP